MAARTKMKVFWDDAPCSLVDINRSFRATIALMMEAVSISETSVNFYQTTWRNISEDSQSCYSVLVLDTLGTIAYLDMNGYTEIFKTNKR
jgi:hypothetical protein